MIKVWLLFLILFVSMVPSFARSHLKADEFVMFFPDIAMGQTDGSFKMNISAWVFEEKSRPLAVSVLARYMGIRVKDLTPDQQVLFAVRTRFFRTDSERGKQLAVSLADGQMVALPKTNAAGRARGQFSVHRGQVQWQDAGGGIGWIPFTLQAPGHALHGQRSRAWVIPSEGVSIVSDIDDTLKYSNVLNRKALLRNTFIEPFKAVPGMAEWYQEIANLEPNAFFHYLSASPMQLYPALSEFLDEAHFPAGMLHLRESTSLRTAASASKEVSTAHKKRILTRLLSSYPRRQFILIGDSGERDPEIYADIARAYPGQVKAIHIRNVTGEGRDAVRYQKTFSGIDAGIWQIRD
jgi:hypothetical protein